VAGNAAKHKQKDQREQKGKENSRLSRNRRLKLVTKNTQTVKSFVENFIIVMPFLLMKSPPR